MVFFFRQKTVYEMRISDGSSDVCSSDLQERLSPFMHLARPGATPMEMECDALCGAGKLQDLKAQFSLSFLHERVGASHEWTADSLRKNLECPYRESPR